MKLIPAISIASLLGSFSVLGWAPYGWWPITLFGYAGLFWLISCSQTTFRAGLIGLAFGIGIHLFGSGWVFGALHNKAGMGLFPAVFSTLIFVIYLASFTAVPCLLWRAFSTSNKKDSQLTINATMLQLTSVFNFASLLTLGEWARGIFFNGFTSLALGYSLIDTWLTGFAPVFGLYGLSFIGFCISGILATLIFSKHINKTVILLSIFTIFASAILLNQIKWTYPFGEPLSYRLIQSNVPQEHKFDPKYNRQQTLRLIKIIENHPADIIATPETAFPMFLNELPDDAISGIQQFSKNTSSHIFLGIATIASNSDGFNSVIHISPDQVEITQYNKVKLMPFGEYTPAGFGWFTNSLNIPLKDMNAGDENQMPFSIKSQRIGALICHEDLTGQEVRHWLPDATLLLNPSNLAWFEGSLAIGQRIQIVRMRAIESGRPILRVTNTGITAQIDAQGAVLSQLPIAVEGVLTGNVQPTLGFTPFARWGNFPAISGSALCFLFAGYIAFRNKANK